MFPLRTPEKVLLGPLIAPFERSRKAADRKVVNLGEDHRNEFLEFIHDAVGNNRPTVEQGYIELSEDEAALLVTHGKSTSAHENACFLWVIDEISIKMIKERTRNERRENFPFVCHTNLTEGGKAFLGGELYFCVDTRIYISQKSDRYGWAEPEQWEAGLNYFKRVFQRTEFVVLSPQ